MRDLAQLSDEELARLVGRGIRDALEVLYERYSSAVFSLARAMVRDSPTAEEITQDVFVRLWRRASTFNLERGSLYTWLMSITHHRAVDEIRKRRRRMPEPASLDALPPGRGPVSPLLSDEEAVRNWREGEVRDALMTLPEEQRRIVIMAYFEGYSHSEIARLLEQPLGTVKTRLRLALQKLRVLLQEREVV